MEMEEEGETEMEVEEETEVEEAEEMEEEMEEEATEEMEEEVMEETEGKALVAEAAKTWEDRLSQSCLRKSTRELQGTSPLFRIPKTAPRQKQSVSQ